jgi:hypothetical protein
LRIEVFYPAIEIGSAERIFDPARGRLHDLDTVSHQSQDAEKVAGLFADRWIDLSGRHAVEAIIVCGRRRRPVVHRSVSAIIRL